MFTKLTFSIALASTVLFGTAAMADTLSPLQIFVSKDTQSLVVYDGDQIVATSNVSTGKAGHTTPSGIFSILEKKKTHFSNLYDDAPMPWMQRITWSGVALHESKHVPDYPASHGCVRMPKAFAKQLFGMTKRGFHVVISDREIAPHMVTGTNLFQPRYAAPSADLLSDAEFRPAVTVESGAELAMNETLPKAGAIAIAALPKEEPPVKLLITRATEKQRIAGVQAMLTRLGYDTGGSNGVVSKKTRDAIKAYQDLHSQKVTGQLTPELTASLAKVMNRKPVTGWLYVRRNFKPVFDAAVDIDQMDMALGTHFFTALHVNPAQNRADWYATTMDNHISAKTAKRLGITSFPDAFASNAADAAFQRVTIPDDIRSKIETMLGSGSSMTITDIGTESETGLGTDFITITKKPPAVADAG